MIYLNKKKHYKLYYRGSQTVFKIPWPRDIKCPPNQNLMKPVLENKNKNTAP